MRLERVSGRQPTNGCWRGNPPAIYRRVDIDENVERKELLPSEYVPASEELEKLERKAAKERQQATQAKPGEQIGGGKLPPPTEEDAGARGGEGTARNAHRPGTFR